MLLTMKINRQGTSRIVICIGKYAFKIPNFLQGMRFFLIGCSGNYNERFWYKLWLEYSKSTEDLELQTLCTKRLDILCPTLFCSWFGLLSIQYKAIILQDRVPESILKQVEELDLSYDIKPQNFGYLNNKIVLVDYQ